MAWYTIFKNGSVMFDGNANPDIALLKFDEVKLSHGQKKQLFRGKWHGRLIKEEYKPWHTEC